MNKSNISKVINKMKMFFLFSMLPISVAAVFDPSLIIDRKTLAELSQKLEDFFNNHGFFSTCCKPAEENDEIIEKNGDVIKTSSDVKRYLEIVLVS